MNPVDTMQTAQAAPSEYLFRPLYSKPPNIALYYVGAVLLIVFACFGFFIAVMGHTSQLSMQGMTTLPILLAINLIFGAQSKAKVPREVGVGPQGVRVVRSNKTDLYTWDQIGSTMALTNSFSQRKELILYDRRGKALVKIDQALEPFDYMKQLTDYYIALQGNAPVEQIRTSKARRNAVFVMTVSIVLLAVSIANWHFSAQSDQAAKLLETQSVPGRAQIERRFLAPNGVTPRLEYQITTPDGKVGTHNAQVEREYWDSLAGKSTVPVVYVPSDPDITRLASGEIDDNQDNPTFLYLVSGLVGVMSIVFFAAGILMWRGMDFKIDSKTGKVAVKRYGA